MNGGNYRILYNSNAGGANTGDWTPICKEDAIVPVTAHLDTVALDHCSSASVSVESCLQAVRDLMPEQEVGSVLSTPMQSGSYATKPPGCSMETETFTAYYNIDGGGHNNGDYTLVCADESSLSDEHDALKVVVEGLEEEVQQQQEQIDDLKAENEQQQEQIDDVQEQIDDFKEKMGNNMSNY